METLETGQFALVRVRPNGNAQQMGMTKEQSKLFQLLVASLSSDDSPLLAMPKQHDLVLCQQANQWISVKDRLPADDKTVIAFDSDFECVGLAKFRKGYFSFVAFSGLSAIANVTHWQPLPEPPKGGR